MEGQDTEQELITTNQPLLRVKITEGGLDILEAEGVESVVMHMVTEWRARMDTLRADAVNTMERMRGRGLEGLEMPSRH